MIVVTAIAGAVVYDGIDVVDYKDVDIARMMFAKAAAAYRDDKPARPARCMAGATAEQVSGRHVLVTIGGRGAAIIETSSPNRKATHIAAAQEGAMAVANIEVKK